MPLPTNINAYSDVQEILNEAVRRNGAVYRLATPQQATAWRQRAYMFRKLYWRQLSSATLDPTYVPTSPYDHMVLRVRDCAVHISFERFSGTLESPDGKVIQPEKPEPEEDPLLKEATDLLKELGDDEDPDDIF